MDQEKNDNNIKIYNSSSLRMTLMIICIKMACFRSSQWFSIRISVLEHLLHRAQNLRLEDGDSPYGVGTQNEGNVHQAVICVQELRAAGEPPWLR